MLAAAAGELEGEANDALHFLLGVAERVDGLAAAGVGPAFLGLAEVDAAGELAQDDHVDVLDDVALERGVVGEEGEHLDGADVGKEPEAFAQAEDRLLRPDLGAGLVPLGAADGAEEDGVLFPAEGEVFGAEGGAVGVDGGAADGRFGVGELVAELAADDV